MTDRRLTQTLRDQVRARDGGRCVDCGTTEGLSFQHRENSGAGGRGKKAPTLTPADGLCCCVSCNTSYEAQGQSRALHLGYKLKRFRGGVQAHQVPYLDRNHFVYFLPNLDGTRTPIEHALAHELLAAAGAFLDRYETPGIGELL